MDDPLSIWLDGLGLKQYARIFAENDVGLDALRLLSAEELHELAVSLAHRKKLLKAATVRKDTADSAPAGEAMSLGEVPAGPGVSSTLSRMTDSGDLHNALQLIDEQSAQVERHGSLC